MAILLPQGLHEFIEICSAFTAFAQQQIQTQCNQTTFVVVANDVVDSTGVLFIKLGPGVKAGLRNALFEPTGVAH